MARLLLGPALRRVAGDRATVWLETDGRCQVEISTDSGAGGRAGTFTAFGHHYAMVVLSGLPPASAQRYQVRLDGTLVWPPPHSRFPPSRIRTLHPDQGVRLVFGSCRQSSPYALNGTFPPDALDCYAVSLAGRIDADSAEWPDSLLLLGDQVYADEVSEPNRRHFRRRRRRTAQAAQAARTAQAAQAGDFEDYTRLYHESWTDPEIRWLLSTVPSAMIFDDHEVVDDWNTSAPWRRHIEAQPWWRTRIIGALASYWIYQHLGNLSPDELESDPVFAAVCAADDATEVLTELALRADGTDPSTAVLAPRWSYRLDVGRTRAIVLDARCSRLLEPGARQILPTADWAWLRDQLDGDYDHLVIGTSLPWLLAPAIHKLEAWNERLCESPHRPVARASEWLRQSGDLEHWAAFRDSFESLGGLITEVARGRHTPRPPATISVLSGDVHHSYVAAAHLPVDVSSRVYQLTCSPIHNDTPHAMRVGFRVGWSRPMAAAGTLLCRLAGVPAPPLDWEKVAGPHFGNALGLLHLDGRAGRVTLAGTEATTADGPGRLVPLAEVELTSGGG